MLRYYMMQKSFVLPASTPTFKSLVSSGSESFVRKEKETSKNLRCRETTPGLIKQVPVPDWTETIFDDDKLRPFELVLRHERLD